MTEEAKSATPTLETLIDQTRTYQQQQQLEALIENRSRVENLSRAQEPLANLAEAMNRLAPWQPALAELSRGTSLDTPQARELVRAKLQRLAEAGQELVGLTDFRGVQRISAAVVEATGDLQTQAAAAWRNELRRIRSTASKEHGLLTLLGQSQAAKGYAAVANKSQALGERSPPQEAEFQELEQLRADLSAAAEQVQFDEPGAREVLLPLLTKGCFTIGSLGQEGRNFLRNLQPDVRARLEVRIASGP